MSAEVWLPVVGWDGWYEVSDRGQVRSVERMSTAGRLLPSQVRQPSVSPKGYQRVSLYRGSSGTTYAVHRLVAIAFLGDHSGEGLEVCHNDGNPTNNAPSNLRWDTSSANSLDTVAHGAHREASKTHCKNGHEYTVENTYYRSNGRWRNCRTCILASNARSRKDRAERVRHV